MAGNILGTTKLNAQIQMALIEYGDGARLKLMQSNGWGFIKGAKRGRLEIMAEILCYCNQKKAKTDIMYKVNLNYAQLKRHQKSLTSQGLLTTNSNKFVTTQKGHRFLEIFAQLNAILNS